MSKVHKGRFTAEVDGEFVVFLIGMRFNKLWKVHKWLPPFLAMPKMLRELGQHPEKGLLHAQLSLAGRTVSVTQYWRSFEQLQAFSRDVDDPHLTAWRRFNARVGASGDVGIYHETYRVAPGDFECVYANMPVYGLAAAGDHVPVGRRTESAADRLNAAVPA
jgi:hypothetical protein